MFELIVTQLIAGLDKGSAYALIALGLTIIFGTLGVVNFAHGALFSLGAFVVVAIQKLIEWPQKVLDESFTLFKKYNEIPYVDIWFGESVGGFLADYSLFIAFLVAIPFMALIGYAMERGLIRFFYKRTHAEQILVTFGLAIVLQELLKAWFGANSIQVAAPAGFAGPAQIGQWFGMGDNLVYPLWRLIYIGFALVIIAAVFAFLQFTKFGMIIRAGMADRETVGLLGINIDRRFTFVFSLAAVITGIAGVMYAPNVPPDYHMGSEWLVLSFVVVVVGGMGSLGGAVLAGFLLGILESFSSLQFFKEIIPGIDQIIVYVVAVIILMTLPRGLLGRKGVMES